MLSSPLELSSDQTIRSHLAALYDTLLEQNLLRIIEPYSTVQVSYVAETVGQGTPQVEAKCVAEFSPDSSVETHRTVQTLADDPGQGAEWSFRPGERVPCCVQRARGRCKSCAYKPLA